MQVPIDTKAGFVSGTPQQVFQADYFPTGHDFDVMPDGKQFVFIKEMQPAQAATQINVVLNWFEELKQRMSGATKR
jgi:hypothetical protein